MNDRFHYDALVDDALRSVVKRVLVQVAEKGLPGSHHFYISFRSTDPGVELPDYLRAKYPEEMTIVLQHQYWNLRVHDTWFEVELSFDNVPEHLVIPFDAVKGFLDPAVQFGLQFETQAQHPRPREVEPATPAAAAKSQPAPAAAEDAEEDKPAQDEAAKVVSLDQFRKK